MPFVETRLISPTTLTTSAASALYTVPTGYSAIIKQFVVTNISASAATFTFYVGTASASNALFSGTSVAANDTVIINLSQVVTTGETLRALASVGSALNLTVSGVINDGPLASTATYIADNAITVNKIADGSVTTAKIAAGAVDTVDIANNAVTQAKLASALAATTITTSALRSTAVPSPFAGQTVFETDTNKLLVWNGTAWVIPNSPAQNPQGLEYITSGTLTTSGIDGIFTSTYDNYRILLTNVTTSGGALLNFNYRTTANATDSTNTYYTAGRRFDNGTNYDFSQGANTYATTAINCEASGAFGTLVMDIFSPRLTARTISSINGMGQISQISTVQASTLYNATTSFAGIIFSSSAFTISGGTYTVYGYRKAA